MKYSHHAFSVTAEVQTHRLTRVWSRMYRCVWVEKVFVKVPESALDRRSRGALVRIQ